MSKQNQCEVNPEMPRPVRKGDGWVAINRAIRSHWLVGFGQPVTPMDPGRGSYSRAESFIDLIMECQYEAGFINNGGHKMEIQPGQLVGAVSYLAERWNWTPKTVRGWLDRLQSDNMIEKQATKQGKQAAIITVCNYSEYQVINHLEGQSEGNVGAIRGQQYKEEHLTLNTVTKTPLPPKGDGRAEINRAAAKAAFAEWQDFAKRIGLSIPRQGSFETFGRKIAARMFEFTETDAKTANDMLATWRQAMANVERSKFLRGMTDVKFKADLKFLCQRESFAKLIEGGYGNGAHIQANTNWSAVVAAPDPNAPLTGMAKIAADLEINRQNLKDWDL